MERGRTRSVRPLFYLLSGVPGFAQHRAGTGAKYTRAHPPEAIVYREELPDKPAALRRELAIKGLRREAKLRLIDRAGAAPGTPDRR